MSILKLFERCGWGWGLNLLLALIAAGCSLLPQTPPTAPTPQVFNSPASYLSTYTIYFHEGCHFGGAVDIEYDTVVVGAPCWGRPPGEGIGSAYVLRKSAAGELTMEATLTASDRDDGFQYDQHFGEAVAIQGKVIAVGVPGYDDPQAGDNIGAVYLFEDQGAGWAQTARLTASAPKPGAKLGRGLAFDGELLAASGAPEAGSVVIFQRQAGGWREQAVVPVHTPPGSPPYYTLIDLYGDTLAVSATAWQEPQKEADFPQLLKAGVVAVYERAGDAWKLVFQTPPLEASLFRMRPDSPFGMSVALGGEAGRAAWLAVGRPGFGGSGRELGSVDLYGRSKGGWTLQAELGLAPGEPAPGGLPFFGPDPGAMFFGTIVAMQGDRLAVVSAFANTGYVFERQGQGWAYRFRIVPMKMNGGDDFQRRTVVLSGDNLLMGSPGDLGGGEVYLFNLSP